MMSGSYDLHSVPKNINAVLKEHGADALLKEPGADGLDKIRQVTKVLKGQPVVKEMQKSLNSLTIKQRVALFRKGIGCSKIYSLYVIAAMCIAGRQSRQSSYVREQQMQRQPLRSPWNELGKGR